jgi:hypothetical protein
MTFTKDELRKFAESRSWRKHDRAHNRKLLWAAIELSDVQSAKGASGSSFRRAPDGKAMIDIRVAIDNQDRRSSAHVTTSANIPGKVATFQRYDVWHAEDIRSCHAEDLLERQLGLDDRNGMCHLLSIESNRRVVQVSRTILIFVPSHFIASSIHRRPQS